MSRFRFAIFFSIVFSIYGLINYYLFRSGWNAVQGSSSAPWLLALFLVFSLSFIAGRFAERVTLAWPSAVLVWVGSFWLAGMVYLLMAAVLSDLIGLFGIRLVPASVSDAEVLGAIIAVVVVIVAAGYVNARSPRISTRTIRIAKNGRRFASLNIVAASDIHLGTIVCKSRLERIVEKINALKPDLVLLPGDVVDEDIGPVIRQNLGETLRKIDAKYGVLAITGNHEYIGGVEEACQYLVDHGIVMLRDAVHLIEESVVIVGREDRSIGQFAGKKRKSLHELLENVNRTLPIILMDHQPFRLDEAEKEGVDIQLSGHTHHGQLWPFNFITRRIFEVSRGYKKKGNLHVYVSAGVGTWGPPVRTGNRPEIVQLLVMFE
jgi:predicted MPP superfamily phosphohydrolase